MSLAPAPGVAGFAEAPGGAGFSVLVRSRVSTVSAAINSISWVRGEVGADIALSAIYCLSPVNLRSRSLFSAVCQVEMKS